MQLSVRISCGKSKGKLFKVEQKQDAACVGQAYGGLSNKCSHDPIVASFAMTELEVQVNGTAYFLHKNKAALSKAVYAFHMSTLNKPQR